jgi:threonine dehydratase
MPNDPDTIPLPTLTDVEAAAHRLAGKAVLTPLLPCPALDARTAGTILMKAEPLQRTGSFKFRGAFNRLACLDPAARAAGVVAWSSGNHAQGVAAAASLLGIPALIVMPADAPAIKIAGTRALGAEIVFYDRATEDREQVARTIALSRGATIVPSYDDPYVIAGQGTIGLEIMAQAAELGLAVDDVIVPASGGGLAAGIGIAVKAARPAARLFVAEPEHYDDHVRSLAAGRRCANASAANAFCDALLARTPGVLTWRLNQRQLSGGYAVSDAAVRDAMVFAFSHMKIVVEPGGAIALAALLSGAHDARGRVTAVVLSGGNIDEASFCEALSHATRVG